MKVLIYQSEMHSGMSEAISKVERIVENNSADIYIFPELFLTNYLIRDEIYRQSISKDSEKIEKIVDISRKKNCTVIVGFPEKFEREIYNSALVAANGEKYVYRKIHLPNFGPFEEKIYFHPGDEELLVDTGNAKIGVQICYDLFFPELSKILALRGAEIIVNISASPVISKKYFETLIPARAVETTTFFVYANWAGTQRNMVFWGGSRVVKPSGDIVSIGKYFEEDVVIAEINLDEIDAFRRVRPVLRDTVWRWF